VARPELGLTLGDAGVGDKELDQVPGALCKG
jgi:hypothetical protein